MWIPQAVCSLGMRVSIDSFTSIITVYKIAPSETLTSEATQVSSIVSGIQISSTVVGTDTTSIHDIVQALSSSSDLQQGSSAPLLKWPPPSLPPPTPTPTANADHASLDYTSRISAPLVGGLCGGSFLVISTAIVFFLRRRRLSIVAEQKYPTSSRRISSLRALAVNLGPPLQPPSPSRPKFSDIDTNFHRIAAINDLFQIGDQQSTPQPIFLSLQMFRNAANTHHTGYEKINSPIEVIERYQQQPHLHQETLSSRGNQTEDPDRNIITDTENRPTSAAYSEPPPTYENRKL